MNKKAFKKLSVFDDHIVDFNLIVAIHLINSHVVDFNDMIDLGKGAKASCLRVKLFTCSCYKIFHDVRQN